MGGGYAYGEVFTYTVAKECSPGYGGGGLGGEHRKRLFDADAGQCGGVCGGGSGGGTEDVLYVHGFLNDAQNGRLWMGSAVGVGLR